jgi:hypothetical protein
VGEEADTYVAALRDNGDVPRVARQACVVTPQRGAAPGVDQTIAIGTEYCEMTSGSNEFFVQQIITDLGEACRKHNGAAAAEAPCL